MRGISVRSVIGAAALLAFAAAPARANTITPEATAFTPGISIVYDADFTSGELHAGDGFTIFDIAGFTGFGAVNAFFAPSNQLVGSAFGVAPLGADNASLMNVNFTYTGPTIQTVFLPVAFGPFTVLTTATSLTVDDWVSIDHLIGTVAAVGDGAVGSPHKDQIVVPEAAAVPDGGSTAALLGSVLVAFGMLRRRLS